MGRATSAQRGYFLTRGERIIRSYPPRGRAGTTSFLYFVSFLFLMHNLTDAQGEERSFSNTGVPFLLAVSG